MIRSSGIFQNVLFFSCICGQLSGMELPVGQRAGPIKLFESMSKMLPAVIAYGKGNVCYAHRTVGQEKSSLFHPLFVYIFYNTASENFGEKRLEIGFVDSCIGSQLRNPYGFVDVLVNIAAGFFQIIEPGLLFYMNDGLGRFCHCCGVKEIEEIVVRTVRSLLEMRDQIL